MPPQSLDPDMAVNSEKQESSSLCGSRTGNAQSQNPVKNEAPPAKKRRRVHFDTNPDQIHTLQPIQENLRSDIWLTGHEWLLIQESQRIDLSNMALYGARSIDSRGLEWQTYTGSRERRENHQKGVQAVVREQCRQHMAGSYPNVADTAKAYRQATHASQLRAYQTGIQDAAVVRESDGCSPMAIIDEIVKTQAVDSQLAGSWCEALGMMELEVDCDCW